MNHVKLQGLHPSTAKKPCSSANPTQNPLFGEDPCEKHERDTKENSSNWFFVSHSTRMKTSQVFQAKLQVSCGSALVSPSFTALAAGLRLLFSPGECLGEDVVHSGNGRMCWNRRDPFPTYSYNKRLSS